MTQKKEILAEVTDLSKNFGITVALNHVNIQFRRGEIRGLIGENGSGKSTLSSILAGITKPSSGTITYLGRPWRPNTAREAVAAGIGIIVQEIGTVGSISVAENIFLGDYDRFIRFGIVDRKKMNEAAAMAMEKIGITGIRPEVPACQYDLEQRKLVELARVMAHDPQLFVVDETSTALSEQGRMILYRLMHRAAEEERCVIFISHDLDELMQHCDTLTVLRDGNIIDNIEKPDFDANDIKRKMIGREVNGDYYRSDNDGYEETVVLRAEEITTMQSLLCFNLELHKGEILGIGGLSECGMHELGKALFGIEKVLDGRVLLRETVEINKPQTAYRNGMGYVSKNRDQESLDLNASIAANIQSAAFEKNKVLKLFISSKKEREHSLLQVDRLAIKCSSIYQPTKALSGGNKQKVVFGKWIGNDADILILDCPTRGVDVGVKAAMYQLIYDMKCQGKSIIIISEELPELCGMSDRLLIMKDGKITGEFFRKDGFDNVRLIECMI